LRFGAQAMIMNIQAGREMVINDHRNAAIMERLLVGQPLLHRTIPIGVNEWTVPRDLCDPGTGRRIRNLYITFKQVQNISIVWFLRNTSQQFWYPNIPYRNTSTLTVLWLNIDHILTYCSHNRLGDSHTSHGTVTV
jgi:hypothetical protein